MRLAGCRNRCTVMVAGLCLALLGGRATAAQPPPAAADRPAQRLQWWSDARFGIFIHFGLYSQAARHEWVKQNERMTDAQYQKYFEQFDPDLYDPKAWARMIKAAGARYAVITAKHHEGFCLFDSRYTDYKVTKTPYGRDLLREWVEAFRAEGLKVGFYYSLLDWHHPDYTIDRNHPQRPADESQYETLNKGRDMGKYREYIKSQVRELLTNYGEISVLWLDYSFPGKHGKDRRDWDSANLLKMVRELQPGILVDDRLDLYDVEDGWDFLTPEQFKVEKWPERNGRRVPWETCQTFSGSWGYYRDESTWKDPKQLLGLLVESVSKGGNLLLNVGPTGRGTIDWRARERLEAIGEWMKLNGRSIYGATQAPPEFLPPENCLLTYNPAKKRVYVHCLDWPLGSLRLEGFAGQIKYAQLLHDGSELLPIEKEGAWLAQEVVGDTVVLRLPVVKPNVEIPVIELFLR